MTKSQSDLFLEFIDDFEIVFDSPQQRLQKYQVFQSNVEKINQLNALHYPKTEFGINKFALLSQEEFKKTYLSSTAPVRTPEDPVAPLFSQQEIEDLPKSFDWRTKNVVTPVKDQGSCGSCWAFSTTGNVEGQWALAGNKLTSLSEQNLVDCDHECREYENQKACDAGCNGGLQPNAFTYIMKNGGIDTEASYPYEGVDDTCRFKKENVGAKINNFTFVSKDEDQMAAYLVSHGPLSIAANAVEWQFYIGGVFYIPCGTDLDHGILIVGYGVETDIFFQTMPYWIVKNSWGTGWGKDGYLWIERGDGKCGLNQYVTSSIINK
eukprot:TRINITY_DN11639_c0_g1_i1.p1 TRINITY_DN11639_c0_g1~~TRINITY_DN11639_c0_g1_i1.p1  ORF type:complete len:359 (-),score=89.52 TRINITY_DN11639_c0_g1_i1:51-1016(-)